MKNKNDENVRINSTVLQKEEDIIKKEENRFCLRCGRKLKNPEYIRLGYGPVCYEKVKNNSNKRLFNVKIKE